MRVAMVSEHASPLAALGGVDAGGQNVHVAALSGAIGRRGVRVTVHTRRDSPALPRRVSMGGRVTVDHVEAGPPAAVPKDELLPYMARFADDLRDQWEMERPDVVHGHFWMSGKAAVEAARPLGIPVVQTFHALGVVKRRHQGDRDTSPPERVEIEKKILAEVDRVIATCTDEGFELIRLGGDRRRVSTIPCGVDVHHFTPEGPVDPRRPGLHRLLALVRLVERKGVGDVVAALPSLPDVELVVAGGPAADQLSRDPEARRLRSLSERLGVADRVELRGRVERSAVPPLLRSADLAVCVPWYEPFGIVPLEAMACGVPVVASRVGGLIDSVVDGVTGVHVPPRRPRRLASAARALLADPEHRGELGAAGTRRARARYGWDGIAEATLDVYRDLLTTGVRGEREALA